QRYYPLCLFFHPRGVLPLKNIFFFTLSSLSLSLCFQSSDLFVVSNSETKTLSSPKPTLLSLLICSSSISCTASEAHLYATMEAQSPATKVARIADSEMGTDEGGERKVVTSVGLDLGLGSNTIKHGKSTFTFLQLQELEHQALIYKYMAAGIPVPSHLVLPIWKSLGNTYAGTGIYPTFLGCRGVCFDYRNSMEPEPGRCRRTDGKKWRCAKDVVPDQKYCERHMHRGRNRSRKHVENTSTQTVTIASSSPSSNSTNVSVPFQLMSSTPTTTISTNSIVSSGMGLSPNSVLQENGAFKTETSSL
ncbi:hypothetical protein AQUCO_01300537v1, partial [Aquilegia coerulea]